MKTVHKGIRYHFHTCGVNLGLRIKPTSFPAVLELSSRSWSVQLSACSRICDLAYGKEKK